jgi:hypothetical protein
VEWGDGGDRELKDGAFDDRGLESDGNRRIRQAKAKSLAAGFCSECENNQHDHRRNDQG